MENIDKTTNLDTSAKNTWCPGCPNFGILASFKNVINSLINDGVKREDIVVVGDIGCNSKIVDYLNLNSFSSLHGRPIATAQGIKIGNPNLKVIVFSGDGGTFNEGVAHLIHAAKRNIDITVLIHDNRTFALTTGQFTATSPKNFKGKSTPEGSVEIPINPLELVLAARGTFIARAYALRTKHLERIMTEAIEHKGFSFVDILQPCISFFDTTNPYNESVFEMEEKDIESHSEALRKIREWDYDNLDNVRIPLGLFYKVNKPTFWAESLKDLNFSNKEMIDFDKFLDKEF